MPYSCPQAGKPRLLMPEQASIYLVKQIRELGLWPQDEQEQRTVTEIGKRCSDAKQFVQQMLQRGHLTAYQANKLLTGKGDTLQVGPYILLERVGEGGMGKVYKARHRRLHKIVALKVIRSEKLTNKIALKRFYREIQAVARLAHPNIVWAFDADQSGDLHYLAMQYVPGKDMRILVKESGPLDPMQAADFFRQAALGLGHIHENGMVHRDIKPSNLLVAMPGSGSVASDSGVLSRGSPHGTVKITDLGLTRLCYLDDGNRLTHMGTTMGTVDYIAPEQARNSQEADIRSDIYALGCSMYYALTGSPPFKGESQVEKMLAHQMEIAEPIEQIRPDVPVALCEIVRRMMIKDPARRFQTPDELVAALEGFRKGVVSVGNGGGGMPLTAPAAAVPSASPLLFVPKSRSGPAAANSMIGLTIAGIATASLSLLILLLWLFLR